MQIIHNYIHDCTLGTWLDWQAQGARISRNLFRKNDRDLMMEVTHGPYIVDNNIFASEYNFDNIAQGGAYIHNLCCGMMRREPVMDRSTPYHFPHSTEVAGTALVYSGDDRIFQNIFLGGAEDYTEQSLCGTAGYNGHTASLEEYMHTVASLGNEDHEQFEKVRQPVYINGNAYMAGAQGYEREINKYIGRHDPKIRVALEADGVYLEMDVEEGMLKMPSKIYETKDLGMPKITEAAYENPDGSPVVFKEDYLGRNRGKGAPAGPLAVLKAGRNRIKIWDRE